MDITKLTQKTIDAVAFRPDVSGWTPKPKPIFCIGIPFDENIGDAQFELSKADEHLLSIKDDYHVIVYLALNVENPIIQVFYEKDFDEIRFEELKAIIERSCKK